MFLFMLGGVSISFVQVLLWSHRLISSYIYCSVVRFTFSVFGYYGILHLGLRYTSPYRGGYFRR